MSVWEDQYYPPLERPPLGIEPKWWPINAAQQAAINSHAELLLMGGQSGGGKSFYLAADAMQEYRNPHLRALLIRKTYKEMQALKDIQKAIYTPYGARWVATDGQWEFPSGATIRPGYLSHDKDLDRYQGNSYSWLGIDESGQHPEHRIRYLMGWLAANKYSGLRVRARFTSNPGGIGHGWQLHVFLRNRCPFHFPAPLTDDRPFETSVLPARIYRGACWTDGSPVYKTTAFIPARLDDNPLYGEDKRTSLMSQPKAIQQQMLYGCWCNAAGLYFDFMRPDDVVPYATIGDSWWWQHFLSIDYGYGNSAAAAGEYAISPNGVVFKVRERVERKLSALNFALGLCKKGFPRTEFPAQAPQSTWLKKLKARDPEPPRMAFCVMDEAMDQHRGTGKSVFGVMSEVFAEHGISSIKAAHDPAGNAQVCYNGLANKQLVLTRESSDLPLSYRALSSRIVDDRKAVKKIQGAWEDDVYDECLAKGTLVATERGSVPIEQITVGDKVWTRSGLKSVLWSGLTQVDAALQTIWLSNGRSLTGTVNHPVFIARRGFIRLDETAYGDNVLMCPESRQWSLTAPHLGATPTQRDSPRETISPLAFAINAEEWTCSIGKSGSTTMGQSRTAITFTTQMKIRRTMIMAISNALIRMRTPLNTRQISGRSQRQGDVISGNLIDLQTRGTERRPVRLYTVASPKIIGRSQHSKHLYASSAETRSSLTMLELTNSAHDHARPRQGGYQGLIMQTLCVPNVRARSKQTVSNSTSSAPISVLRRTTGGRGEVYNLSIADAEEFFANGILVHNCSYAYNTWRQNSEKPARTALADELVQLRKEGLDETSIARIAWQREQTIQAKEKETKKGVRLTSALETPRKR